MNSALERVRQAAQRDRKKRMTALLHHVYAIDSLERAYRGMNRKASPGVDGQTWESTGKTWRPI